jgi:hypothetical protein
METIAELILCSDLGDACSAAGPTRAGLGAGAPGNHTVAQHGPERYAIDDTDVWLMLERPPKFDPSWPHKIDLVVAPKRVAALTP